MMNRVRRTVAEYLFRVSVVEEHSKADKTRHVEHSHESPLLDSLKKKAGSDPVQTGQGTGKPQPVRKGKKIGRNDPCPCGSGKKYKHCCGKNR